MEAVLVAGAIAWWCVGAFGFVFWWTTECDLTPVDLVTMVFVGAGGPLTWVVGAGIHGRRDARPQREPLVLIKRRL